MWKYWIYTEYPRARQGTKVGKESIGFLRGDNLLTTRLTSLSFSTILRAMWTYRFSESDVQKKTTRSGRNASCVK